MRISDWSSDVCSSDLSPDVPPKSSVINRSALKTRSLSAGWKGRTQLVDMVPEKFGVGRFTFSLEKVNPTTGGSVKESILLRVSAPLKETVRLRVGLTEASSYMPQMLSSAPPGPIEVRRGKTGVSD